MATQFELELERLINIADDVFFIHFIKENQVKYYYRETSALSKSFIGTR